jgi:hypothetical protein
MPAVMYVPKTFVIFFKINNILIRIINIKTNTVAPPIKPHSSERILKIKSVLCCGRNR